MTGDVPRMQPYRGSRTEEDVELVDQIAVDGVQRTPNGTDITEGRAATQTLKTTESVALAADGIAVEGDEAVATRHTAFASVPGEFVVVERGGGTFLFDLIGRVSPGSVERAVLDLDALLDSLPDATLWKLGFFDRDGGAESGVVHGADVLADAEFGAALADLPKNQVGLDVERDGVEYRLNAARSGYVELYRPADVSTADFVEFVHEEILPHAN